MPLDPFFSSKSNPNQSKLNRYGKPEPKPQLESVEMQLGRSDHRLGLLQQSCPFPDGTDATEWTRGWLAEKQIELQAQLIGAQKHLHKHG